MSKTFRNQQQTERTRDEESPVHKKRRKNQQKMRDIVYEYEIEEIIDLEFEIEIELEEFEPIKKRGKR